MDDGRGREYFSSADQNSLQERVANGLREISKSGDRKHELGTVFKTRRTQTAAWGVDNSVWWEQEQARLEGEVEKRLHRCLGAGW